MLASLPEHQRKDILASLTEAQAEELGWDWEFWARPAQKEPPGDWLTWLILAGRGYGKTKTGAETIRQWACGKSPLAAGRYRRFLLIAETAADARDVMVEGESGILSVHPKDFRPLYEPSKRRLTWPNGAVASLFNATEPDQLRGPQGDAAWCDELAKWQYARETWDMLQFGLRLGDNPRQIVTTTPRPVPVIKELLVSPTTVVTRGSTLENRGNLAPSFLKQITARYEGTRLGRQELDAEVLDDNPGALWTRAMIEAAICKRADMPALARIVVAVDPSGTKGDEEGDDVGIVAAGRGVDGKLYVLEDKTCQESPAGWGKAAVKLYHSLGADRIVAERNYGGAMVEHVVRTADKAVSYKEVTASRGKWIRAEPVAALYEQGKVRHVGSLPELEDEMCAFGTDGLADGKSPNRLDALVWAATELMLGEGGDIVSRDWWQPWTAGTYPPCSHVLASLNAGLSEKTANEPASLTVWGVFTDQRGEPKAILFYAWQGRVTVHELAAGLRAICSKRATPPAEMQRIVKAWNVPALPQLPVDRLVIEAADVTDAAPRDLAMMTANAGEVVVELVKADQWGDPTARLYGVQHLFSGKSIHAPAQKAFARKVIDNVTEFPAAAHPGLTNSTTLALQYLRTGGLLLRSEEHQRNVAEEMRYRKPQKPLYSG